jgi:hypothetical protein
VRGSPAERVALAAGRQYRRLSLGARRGLASAAPGSQPTPRRLALRAPQARAEPLKQFLGLRRLLAQICSLLGRLDPLVTVRRGGRDEQRIPFVVCEVLGFRGRGT